MRCRELDILKILGIFWIFWGICLEDSLEEFLGRNSLITLLKSAKLLQIDLFVKILVFVKFLSKSKEGRNYSRSLEVRLQVHRT